MRSYPAKVTSFGVDETLRPVAVVKLAPPVIGCVMIPTPGPIPQGTLVFVRPLGCPMSDPWALTPRLIFQRAVDL